MSKDERLKIVNTKLYKYSSQVIIEHIKLPLNFTQGQKLKKRKNNLPDDKLIERLMSIFVQDDMYIYWKMYEYDMPLGSYKMPFGQFLLNWLKGLTVQQLETEFNSHELLELLQQQD